MEIFRKNEVVNSSAYKKKFGKKFIKAIKDYNLIENGDKIAVGVSGGKDSLILSLLLLELKKNKSKNFEIKFISMDPGFKKDDISNFMNNLKLLNINCEIFDSNVWEVAFNMNKENPCFLCAKMRRGILYEKVEELGCTKLALGHHFDDIIETTLINMFYAGALKTMIPKVKSTSRKLELIRPLAYVYEKDIISSIKNIGIKPMTCGCPVEGNKVDSKRKEIKIMLKNLERVNPNIKKSIFSSMKNINLNYVLGYTKENKFD